MTEQLQIDEAEDARIGAGKAKRYNKVDPLAKLDRAFCYGEITIQNVIEQAYALGFQDGSNTAKSAM